MADDGVQKMTMTKIHCKHGKQTYTISISLESTVQELKTNLHSLTNVLPRLQKLIFKGKVLDAKVRLRDAALTNDSKIMMVGSGGDLQSKVKESATKIQPRTDQKEQLDISVRHNLSSGETNGFKAAQMVSSSNIWKATGIISLQDRNLKVIPTQVWETGASARVLDLARNSLEIFPQDVSNLINLKKLRIDQNHLQHDRIQWQGVVMLRQLTVLSLDYNELVSFPSEIGLLSELKHLSIAHNMLQNISDDVGNLSKLETVNLSHNSIVDLPSSIGRCSLLIEVDFSSNRLTELPSSLGQLKKLKALNLGYNAIQSFPSEILKGCVELSTLSLHKNNLTIEDLREVDGWAEFDERRKAKHVKQLDFSLFDPYPGFNEGADSQQWHHW